MRRGSSTVVVVVGQVPGGILESLGRAPNVAIVAEGGARTLAGSPFTVAVDDPLGEIATGWTAMWTDGAGPEGFELAVAAAMARPRAEELELPDYYVVATSSHEAAAGTVSDFHLGFLRSQRPARVVPVVGTENVGELSARIIRELSQLRQSPWWPALETLIGAARTYFPGTMGRVPEVTQAS